jgi:4,5-dihydroxyphthalate decarboxylase
LDKQPPVGIEHHWLTVGQSMDIMLDRGEIDASTAIRPGDPVTVGDPNVIDRHGGTQIEGNPRIKKLLPDNGKGVIYEYRTKTGFFHTNHHVIIQRKIVEENPWVPMELFKAFQRSKLEAYERADKQMSGRSQSDSTILYFEANDFADQAAVLGQDPYPIGLQKMGKNVERAIQGSMEQGLLTKQLKLEDVYHHTTLDT